MTRTTVSFAGLVLILLALCALSGGKLRAKKLATPARAEPVRVLMVGDSLTVGAFGAALRDFLIARCGVNNVAVYGSCGSSPEDWLRSHAEFVTKCGYREQTPRRNILLDYKNGRRPKRVITPRIEDLLQTHRPNVVVIQLGTNWMDAIAAGAPGKESEYNLILDRFTETLHSSPGVRRIVWITPPDSAHFAGRTQRTIERLIVNGAGRGQYELILSSRLTHYIPGKTGGDGIHYNSEAGTEWARRVARELGGKLR
jgi:hypothetical protein